MPAQNGTTLTASISASAEYTRTFNWTISKTVNPDKWDLFTGDEGVSQYSITVTKDSGTDLAVIKGQVCVLNGGDVATENLTIDVDLARNSGGGFNTILTGQLVDVTEHPIINPGENYCYDYSITIPSNQIGVGDTYKVTAHVTITNHSGSLGTPFGPNPSNTTILPALTFVNNSIDVTDTNGKTFSNITDTSTLYYEKTFTCDTDQGINKNTATIILEGNTSGPSDSATVSVNCYALDVSKTASTAFTRTYSWNIDKNVSEDNISFADSVTLNLPIGGTHLAYYKVNVTPNPPVDSDFMASGTISITNPAPISAVISSITDVITGVGSVPVTCQAVGEFPPVLAGNGTTQTCTYETTSGQLTDKTTRTNTATVTIQNYKYSYTGGVPVAIGTTSFDAKADVVFSNTPTNEVDKCVDISDNLYGNVGSANATDPSTWIFSYSRTIGPYSTCGNRVVVNTATFTTVPCGSATATGITGSDTATVNATVSCSGCTFTIGYWKTHAGYTGNNPDLVTKYLPIWLGTPGGIKSIKVTTAAFAVQVFNFFGISSNGINRLYAQLLGAKLNISNGADPTAVSSIIAAADTFLATHNSADWSSLTNAQRNSVNSWQTSLDNYNNGLIGPGHCSESGGSVEITIPEDENIQDTDLCYGINININNSRDVEIFINKKKKQENEEHQ